MLFCVRIFACTSTLAVRTLTAESLVPSCHWIKIRDRRVNYKLDLWRDENVRKYIIIYGVYKLQSCCNFCVARLRGFHKGTGSQVPRSGIGVGTSGLFFSRTQTESEESHFLTWIMSIPECNTVTGEDLDSGNWSLQVVEETDEEMQSRPISLLM